MSLGSGWQTVLNFIYPFNESWFEQPIYTKKYDEKWLFNRVLPKGLEFSFEVHKQNKEKKAIQLPQVDQSYCHISIIHRNLQHSNM